MTGVGKDILHYDDDDDDDCDRQHDVDLTPPPALKNRSSNAYKRKAWVPKHKRVGSTDSGASESDTTGETRAADGE